MTTKNEKSENEGSVDFSKIKVLPEMVSRFSILPEVARKDSLVQKHTDEQGNVDMGGMATEAALTRQNYKMLLKAFFVAAILLFLLALSTFGVSLAAAILAKDTQVDPSSGALMVKNGSDDSAVVKTQEALFDIEDRSIADMSFQELRQMKKFYFNGVGGDVGVQLDVKGVSKTASGRVTLVVEGGGTIVYNGDGIVNATGIAKTLIANFAMDSADDDNVRRRLQDISNEEWAFCMILQARQGDIMEYPRCWLVYQTINQGHAVSLRNSPGLGNFAAECCIRGHNDFDVVSVSTRGECKMRCIETSGCKTADFWSGKCYRSMADTSLAENYPGCTMWARDGQDPPGGCDGTWNSVD